MLAYYDAILAGIPAVMLTVTGVTTLTGIAIQTSVGLAALATLTLIIHAIIINPPIHTTYSHIDKPNNTENTVNSLPDSSSG